MQKAEPSQSVSKMINQSQELMNTQRKSMRFAMFQKNYANQQSNVFSKKFLLRTD